MKKTLKRLFASLMVVVMVLTAAPLSGFVGLELPDFGAIFSTKAEAATYSGTCGDNLNWSFNTGTGKLIISGTGKMYDYTGLSAPWYNYRSSVKTITIEKDVTSIGSFAFNSCENLTNITIPDSVTSIGSNAFACCTSLTSVVIPDSVKSISDYAFLYCDSLTNVTISAESIGEFAFCNCLNLTSVTIGNSVTSIGEFAFGGCDGLAKITVDTNNTVYSSDEHGVFFNKDKTQLIKYPVGNERTSYTVPESVTTIAEAAFSRCTSLTSITIPDSVTSIIDYAFYHCDSLTDVYYYADAKEWSNIEIKSYNEPLLNATIHFNTSNSLEDGLNVFTQNSSMTYVKGDIVLFAVSQVENRILSIPDKLSVTVNNTDVVEVYNMYTYDDIANSSFSALFEHFPEELKKSSFVVFKTKNAGTSVLTLTNTETGDTFSTMISVFEDEYESIRADNIPVKYDRGEAYNYCLNGMVVSDFDYTKASGGYNFTFNCYNQRYSLGVVEVCDSDGTIIQVEKIDKFSNGSSIIGVFKDGWNLAKSFYHGEAMTFKGSQIAKCTSVEVFVPENGFIRITNDSAVSTTCFLVNLFDAIMTAGGIIGDTASLTPKQIDIVDKAVLKKFISNTYYLEFAKNYQEKMANMVIEETTESALLSLICQAGGMAKGLLMDIDLTFEDICRTALGTAYGIGENIFEKVSGPAGIGLSVMFSSQKVLDYTTQMMNWCITTNKDCFAFVMTPFNYDNVRDELSSPDRIKVETNDNVEPETILQTYRVLNNEIKIELGSGEVINDPTLYNIALIKGGKEVQPNGKVRVYIPVPKGYGEDITVLRQNDDGSWGIITNEIVKNGIISFDVTHFCLFAIVDKNIDNGIQNEKGKVRSVSINDISLDYKSTSNITPTISADDGVKYEVTYSSSNTDVVSVNENGKITTNGTGSATITVTVTDEYGNTVSDTCEVKVAYNWWQWIIVIVLFGWIWY